MSPMVKVALAAGGGAYLSKFVEPHLAKLAANLPPAAQQLVGPTAVGVSAAGVYYLLGKA